MPLTHDSASAWALSRSELLRHRITDLVDDKGDRRMRFNECIPRSFIGFGAALRSLPSHIT